MKNWTITRALMAEKKMFVLALGALLAINVSAREVKRVNHRDFRFKGCDKIVVFEPAHRVHGKAIRMAEMRRCDFRKADFRREDFRKAKFRKVRTANIGSGSK